MYNNERVILIKGDHSKWYEQVIFIAKKDIPPGKIPVDFVLEAEKIISSYMEKISLKTKNPACIPKEAPKQYKKKSKSFDILLNSVMLICCVIMAGVLLWGMR